MEGVEEGKLTAILMMGEIMEGVEEGEVNSHTDDGRNHGGCRRRGS